MIEWYKKALLENYANFTGRARRSEYWYFILMNILIEVSLLILFGVFSSLGMEEVGFIFIGIYAIYAFGVLIPSLAVAVRRLHDVGKSGWYYFICLVPLIGSILLIVAFCTEGDSGSNDYGDDPKGEFEEISEIGVTNNSN